MWTEIVLCVSFQSVYFLLHWLGLPVWRWKTVVRGHPFLVPDLNRNVNGNNDVPSFIFEASCFHSAKCFCDSSKLLCDSAVCSFENYWVGLHCMVCIHTVCLSIYSLKVIWIVSDVCGVTESDMTGAT